MLELDGERIVKATPDLGYLHRGVEKLCEGLAYMQIIPHTDRLDYVCAMANNYAYVRAVEKLLDITMPDRAEYIRTIVAEMQRIVGHLFWLGTQALDIGAMTVFFWTFRERETLLDMFEKALRRPPDLELLSDRRRRQRFHARSGATDEGISRHLSRQRQEYDSLIAVEPYLARPH